MDPNGSALFNNLGHIIFDGLSKNPELVVQIDAATGQSETAKSLLHRSTTIARCFRTLGLKPGDVLVLGGRNHLDLRIPFFAAIFNGLPVAGLDPMFKYDEIKAFLELSRPKIAFIQMENYEDVSRAAQELGLDTRVVTFEDGEHSMSRLIQEFGDGKTIEGFQLTNFDGNEIPAFLVNTSGTSGFPKLATLHHGNSIKCVQAFIKMFSAFLRNPPKDGFVNLNLSPVQWISGFFYSFIMPMMGITNVQTSKPGSVDHYVDIINRYKPFFSMLSPYSITAILRSEKPCDLKCFQCLMLTGSKIHTDLLEELKYRVGGLVLEGYGSTETFGMVLRAAPDGPLGNCGQHVPQVNQVKLVDPETGKEITKPHTPGELYVKGNRFSGYYNMPEETKAVFSEDGFFKTGDILYRDENNYYYFVDRVQMLIKNSNNHVIYPAELEGVIYQHPGVQEVAVTSVLHQAEELPVACVVRKPGIPVTGQEIEDLVAEKLSEMKRLRGGVIFLDSMPYTSTGKIARGKLKEFVRREKTVNGV